MADPITLAIGAIAVGSVVKAGSQVEQAQAQSQVVQAQGQDVIQQGNITEQSSYGLEAEAQANDYNVELAKQQADQILSSSNEEARRYEVSSEKDLGELRAHYGASGVTLTGSAMDVLEESGRNAKLNALTIQHQGEVESLAVLNGAALDKFAAGNARTQAQQVRANAQYTKARGKQIYDTADQYAEAGYTAAAGTLLDAGSSIATKMPVSKSSLRGGR